MDPSAGHVCLTAIIGPEAAGLDNGRILLPPEAFVSSQLGAGELVAVSLPSSYLDMLTSRCLRISSCSCAVCLFAPYGVCEGGGESLVST